MSEFDNNSHPDYANDLDQESRDLLAIDWEPTMVEQSGRFAYDMEAGQELIATCKLLSLTLLGGPRFRLAMKLGTMQHPERIVTGVLDVDRRIFQPEGALAPLYDLQLEADDPMEIAAFDRTDWFVSRLVHNTVTRLFETEALTEAAIWEQS